MTDNGEIIALWTLAFTILTTLCALYLAIAALKHGATPTIKIKLINARKILCATPTIFKFAFTNAGRWYAKPTAVDVIVYFNFPPAFTLQELRFGSVQDHIDSDVKFGVGGLKYLKAKGLKLTGVDPVSWTPDH